MRDGEDLLGRVGSALPIVQDHFRSERRKRDRNERPTGLIKSVVSGSLASCHLRYQHLFGLLRPELIAKTSLRSNRGRPFEDEETNPKHQYRSIRLAPSQKGNKGRHNS